MAAIISENFRRNAALQLIENLADANHNYYVGLGQSQPWTPKAGLTEDDPAFVVNDPVGTYADETEVKNNLFVLVGIVSESAAKGFSQAIPVNPARAGRVYKAYNPYDPNCFYQTNISGTQHYPSYCVNGLNVYLCLQSPGTGLTTPPSGTNRGLQIADGYVWVYLYTLPVANPINNSSFIGVPDSGLNGDTAGDISAVTGDLTYSFTVLDGGSGYVNGTSIPYFVADIDGSQTQLVPTIVGGAVTSVRYPSNTWKKSRGRIIWVGPGSGSNVVPNTAPPVGFGLDPRKDLPSWYVGIKTVAQELIDGDGAYIPFRQVSIIKDPGVRTSPAVANPIPSLNALRSMDIAGTVTEATGNRITQGSGSNLAVGIVDYVLAGTPNKLFYHQNSDTGYKPFVTGSVNGATSGSNYSVTIDMNSVDGTGPNNSEYVKESGDVIFVENRKKITRVSGQSEEIVIIIQF